MKRLLGLLSVFALTLAGSVMFMAPNASAACVTLVRWEQSSTSYFAVVRNSCSTKKCYKADLPGRPDGLHSVAKNSTERDAVGSTLLPKPRGIYESAC